MSRIRQGRVNHEFAFSIDVRRLRRWRWATLAYLLVGGLLAASAPAASASPYEIRGEWSIITTPQARQATQAIALINKLEANGEFSGTVKVENFSGTISGTITGGETSLESAVNTPQGLITFVAQKATINAAENKISGSGELYQNGKPLEPATVAGIMLKTYKEVQEREARELKEREEREAKEKKEREEREAKEAKERQEKEVREAKEKKEKEEQEARERPAREQKERELKEQQEREAKELKEHQEHEASEKQARELKERELKERELKEREAREAAAKGGPGPAALLSIELVGATVTARGGESIALALKSPNESAVQGHVALTFTKAAKSSRGHHKASTKQIISLGSASFSLPGHASGTATVKLSQSGRAELTRYKTLHATVTVTTQLAAQTTTKTFDLTLHAPKAAHRKR